MKLKGYSGTMAKAQNLQLQNQNLEQLQQHDSGNPFDDDDAPRKKSPVTPKGKPVSSATAQKLKTAAAGRPPKKGGGNPFDDDSGTRLREGDI